MTWLRWIMACMAAVLCTWTAAAQGTDYVIAIPQNDGSSQTPSTIELTISTKADTALVQVTLPDGAVRSYRVLANAVLALTTDNGGASAAWEIPWAESEQVLDRSVRITSDKPITVYVMHAKGFSSDGYRAIPVRYWGRRYVVASYYDFAEAHPWSGGFTVMAAEDNTTVSILLRGATNGSARTKGGRALNTGLPHSVVLQKGQVYSVFGDGTTRGVFDMTGTLVTSDKPVGVIGFHTRSAVPNSLAISGRDHLIEMLPPTTTWGTRAVTLEIPRLSSGLGRGDFFRVVASENATRWKMTSFDKVTFDTLEQTSGILNAGQFKDITQAMARMALPRGVTVWEADKPIQIIQYSTSAEWDGDVANDPFMCLVTPTTQFVPEATVHASTLKGFTEHRINLFVEVPDSSNPAADLMSLTINGIPIWNHPRAEVPALMQTQNSAHPSLYYATIVVDTAATPQVIAGNGRVRFGGYVYGSGSLDTYGWPLSTIGAAVQGLDTLPPRIVPGSDNCGFRLFDVLETRNVPDPPRPKPLPTDQIESGIADIRLLEGSTNCRLVLVTDTTFLAQGSAYRMFAAAVATIDVRQPAIAIIRATDVQGNSAVETLSLAPSPVQVLASQTDFGRVQLGASKVLPIVIRNAGEGPLTVTSVTPSTNAFSVTGSQPPLPATIGPNDSVAVSLTYAPYTETMDAMRDWDMDTAIIRTSSCSVRHVMRGMGVVPRIQMLDILLDTVDVGGVQCSTLGMAIANEQFGKPGSDTLVVTGVSRVDQPFFVSDPIEPPLPLTIAPGQTAYLGRVCVRGVGNGRIDGNIVVASNAVEGDSTARITAYVRGTVHVSERHGTQDVQCTMYVEQGAVTLLFASALPAAAEVAMIDVHGRQCYRVTVPAGAQQHIVDTSGLALGTYHITCLHGAQRTVFPVVLSR